MSSPVTPITPPDVEYLVIQFVERFLTFGQSVSSEYPTDYNGTQTFVLVTRIGGTMSGALPWLDDASIDISYFGPSKTAAQSLMQTVRPRVLTAWSYQVPGGVFVDAREMVGPIWMADPDYSKAGRYLVQNQITVHP